MKKKADCPLAVNKILVMRRQLGNQKISISRNIDDSDGDNNGKVGTAMETMGMEQLVSIIFLLFRFKHFFLTRVVGVGAVCVGASISVNCVPAIVMLCSWCLSCVVLSLLFPRHFGLLKGPPHSKQSRRVVRGLGKLRGGSKGGSSQTKTCSSSLQKQSWRRLQPIETRCRERQFEVFRNLVTESQNFQIVEDKRDRTLIEESKIFQSMGIFGSKKHFQVSNFRRFHERISKEKVVTRNKKMKILRKNGDEDGRWVYEQRMCQTEYFKGTGSEERRDQVFFLKGKKEQSVHEIHTGSLQARAVVPHPKPDLTRPCQQTGAPVPRLPLMGFLHPLRVHLAT